MQLLQSIAALVGMASQAPRIDFATDTTNTGVFWANSRLLDPKGALSPEAFVRWYENVHIRDILAVKPSAIPAAWRYEAVDQNRTFPYLVVYKLADLAFVQAPDFWSHVPITHPSLPGNHSISEFVQMQVQTAGYSGAYLSKTPDVRSSLLVSETIEFGAKIPDNLKDLYSSYMQKIVNLKGWQRSTRWETGAPATAGWLTLHEFDAAALSNGLSDFIGYSKDEKVKALETSVKKVDTGLFKLIKGFGNETTPLVDDVE